MASRPDLRKNCERWGVGGEVCDIMAQTADMRRSGPSFGGRMLCRREGAEIWSRVVCLPFGGLRYKRRHVA